MFHNISGKTITMESFINKTNKTESFINWTTAIVN